MKVGSFVGWMVGVATVYIEVVISMSSTHGSDAKKKPVDTTQPASTNANTQMGLDSSDSLKDMDPFASSFCDDDAAGLVSDSSRTLECPYFAFI